MLLTSIATSGQMGAHLIEEVLEFVETVQKDTKFVLAHLNKQMSRLKVKSKWLCLNGCGY